MTSKFKKKLGQNTAEYLLMLSIVVVGSIGLLTVFGKTIRAQFGAVTAGLAGESQKYKSSREAAAKGAEAAESRGTADVEAKGMADKEFSSSGK